MRIDGLFQNQTINLSGIEGILERVNIGDIVRAKILDITSNELILKLFDGSTINASTTSDTENLDAKRGDFIDLRVKDKLEGKTILEPLKLGESNKYQMAQEFEKQVKAMGFFADSNNVEIARQMKLNNLPINKEMFENILDTLTKFKDLNPAKVAFMMANKLSVEEGNINALQSLVDEKAKLSGSLNTLMDSIEQINDEKVLKDIAQKLQGSEKSIQAKESLLTADKAIFEAIGKLIDATAQSVNNARNLKSMNENVMLNKIKDFFNANNIAEENLGEKFLSFVNKNFSNGDTGKFSELTAKITSMLKRLEEQSSSNLTQNSTGNLSKSDDIKQQIRNVFDSFSIDVSSQNLKEELNIKNLFKELYSKLDTLKEAVDTASIQNRGEILSNAEKIESSIRFMNQLNNYSTYLQIPLNLGNKTTTGELYILKRESKRKKIDPENATMLISLDTENLGQVDSFIGINKKNISISMRVEDSKIIDFIKNYHLELYEKLHQKGYKLVDLKFRMLETEANILNVNDTADKEFKLGKVSIDYRL